jgi:hypothetical protein
MPTKHPRLALTRDPELDAALRRARERLRSDKPDASLARELMLAGAEVLAPEPEDPFIARLVRDFNARPAKYSTEEMLERLGPPPPVDPDNPYPLSRLIDEMREDTI